MLLIDGDVVEQSNISRQVFIENDIGRNKAQVLADRYGRAFGMEISYVDKYIEDEHHLYNLINEIEDPSEMCLQLFTFVDNVKTRLMVHNFVDEYHKFFDAFTHVDTGNSEFNGQLVVMSRHRRVFSGTTGKVKAPPSASRTPDVVEVLQIFLIDLIGINLPLNYRVRKLRSMHLRQWPPIQLLQTLLLMFCTSHYLARNLDI
jgi:hypothetical protein